jgi:DNA-binding beta-propeller fold protein YncE
MLFAYEANDGTLSELDLDGNPMNGVGLTLDSFGVPHDIAIDATGRSLYVATRQGVHSVAIDPDGLLTARTPLSQGAYRLALLHAWRPRR